MPERWLSVIGLGEDGAEGLAPAARPLLDKAEILMGGERHLAMIPEDARERIPWPSPLLAVIDRLKALRGQKVCILATGDPLWFGIASTLARHFDTDEMCIIPGRSAFSLAAARMAWPIDRVDCVTLHGRPLDMLRASLFPGARILALADDKTTPTKVARLLDDAGFGASVLTVLEHMEGGAETRHTGEARRWAYVGADFHTLAIECVAAPDQVWWARIPGLPDAAFEHDGKMTKQDVRASTLAKLKPAPGALLWDLGVGCGSVAIEWMRAARHAHAIGIDHRTDRLEMASRNALALGVPGLELTEGRVPDALDGLAPPDAVFIGGGLGEDVVERALERLKPGGRLVANAVTLESETVLLALSERLGGELVRISIQHARPVGPYRGWKAQMPVTQWSLAT